MATRSDIADNGEDGLWMGQRHSYDAVILDIMLPLMNGYRVCAELRNDGNWVPADPTDDGGR